jgi:hypothetical protein
VERFIDVEDIGGFFVNLRGKTDSVDRVEITALGWSPVCAITVNLRLAVERGR